MDKYYSVLDYAEDVLKLAQQPLLFQEIWEAGLDKDFYKKLNLTGKTPNRTLGARIFVDVRDNPNSRFIKVGKNPARFFLKSRTSELSDDLLKKIQENETKQSKIISKTLKYMSAVDYPT